MIVSDAVNNCEPIRLALTMGASASTTPTNSWASEEPSAASRWRAGAVVSAPPDGSLLFCGRYRTYGQLLILNAGGGYYMLLPGWIASM